jgi:hypothetical protein
LVTYLPRSAWGARPARGNTGLVRAEVDGTALHWPGMAKPISTYAGVAAALRGWQNYHMDVRGWSDIAYQVAVDQAGRAWTLRGLNIRSGANGDADVNRRYGAILLILAPGEQPSAAMKATVRGVVADFRRWYPQGTAIKPHSAVRQAGTDCPGPLAQAAISRGDFTPRASTSPEETDMPLTDADVQKILQTQLGTSSVADCLAKARWLAEQFAEGGQFNNQIDRIEADTDNPNP